MQQIQGLYTQFLSLFPPVLHPLISVILVIVIVYSLVQVLRRNFIFLIILVILLPASVPLLRSVWQGIVDLIRFLLGTA